MELESRKVLVSFETLNGEKRKVVVLLPPRKSVLGEGDIWVLKKCFLHQLAVENRIHELGVHISQSSITLDQLDIYIYDEDFGELVCLNERIVIQHLEKTLMARLVTVCVEHKDTCTDLVVANHTTQSVSLPSIVPISRESSIFSLESQDLILSQSQSNGLNNSESHQPVSPQTQPIFDGSESQHLISYQSQFYGMNDSDESHQSVSPQTQLIFDGSESQDSQSQLCGLNDSESHQPVSPQTQSIIDDSSFAEPGFFTSTQEELPRGQTFSGASYDGTNGTGGNKSTTPSDVGNDENFELGDKENTGKTPRKLLPLSIPSYGLKPWEFDIVLRNAIEKKNFDRIENKFTRVCATHLINLRPDVRSKTEYTQYSKMIVDTFPHFKHESTDYNYWSIFKEKLLRVIRNRNQASKQASKRKSNGMEKTVGLKAKKTKGDDETSEDETDSFDEETSRQNENDGFHQRRDLIIKEGKKLTTEKCFEIVPCYKTIEGVIKDFMLMEPMCRITKHIYESNFKKLLESLKGYLEEKCMYDTKSIDEKGVLDVLLAVNRLCSSSKGQSTAPLFISYQRKLRFDPAKNGINPYGILIWEGEQLSSMLILGGGVLNYVNINVSTICEAVFKLLSVYYVINMNYPASYGILNVIDRFCLVNEESDYQSTQNKQKGNVNALKKFLNSYQKYCKSLENGTGNVIENAV